MDSKNSFLYTLANYSFPVQAIMNRKPRWQSQEVQVSQKDSSGENKVLKFENKQLRDELLQLQQKIQGIEGIYQAAVSQLPRSTIVKAIPVGIRSQMFASSLHKRNNSELESQQPDLEFKMEISNQENMPQDNSDIVEKIKKFLSQSLDAATKLVVTRNSVTEKLSGRLEAAEIAKNNIIAKSKYRSSNSDHLKKLMTESLNLAFEIETIKHEAIQCPASPNPSPPRQDLGDMGKLTEDLRKIRSQFMEGIEIADDAAQAAVNNAGWLAADLGSIHAIRHTCLLKIADGLSDNPQKVLLGQIQSLSEIQSSYNELLLRAVTKNNCPDLALQFKVMRSNSSGPQKSSRRPKRASGDHDASPNSKIPAETEVWNLIKTLDSCLKQAEETLKKSTDSNDVDVDNLINRIGRIQQPQEPSNAQLVEQCYLIQDVMIKVCSIASKSQVFQSDITQLQKALEESYQLYTAANEKIQQLTNSLVKQHKENDAKLQKVQHQLEKYKNEWKLEKKEKKDWQTELMNLLNQITQSKDDKFVLENQNQTLSEQNATMTQALDKITNAMEKLGKVIEEREFTISELKGKVTLFRQEISSIYQADEEQEQPVVQQQLTNIENEKKDLLAQLKPLPLLKQVKTMKDDLESQIQLMISTPSKGRKSRPSKSSRLGKSVPSSPRKFLPIIPEPEVENIEELEYLIDIITYKIKDPNAIQKKAKSREQTIVEKLEGISAWIDLVQTTETPILSKNNSAANSVSTSFMAIGDFEEPDSTDIINRILEPSFHPITLNSQEKEQLAGVIFGSIRNQATSANKRVADMTAQHVEISSKLDKQTKKLQASQKEHEALTETAMDAVRRGDELQQQIKQFKSELEKSFAKINKLQSEKRDLKRGLESLIQGLKGIADFKLNPDLRNALAKALKSDSIPLGLHESSDLMAEQEVPIVSNSKIINELSQSQVWLADYTENSKPLTQVEDEIMWRQNVDQGLQNLYAFIIRKIIKFAFEQCYQQPEKVILFPLQQDKPPVISKKPPRYKPITDKNNLFKFFDEFWDQKQKKDASDLLQGRRPSSMNYSLSRYLVRQFGSKKLADRQVIQIEQKISDLVSQNHAYAILIAQMLGISGQKPIPYRFAVWLTEVRRKFLDSAKSTNPYESKLESYLGKMVHTTAVDAVIEIIDYMFWESSSEIRGSSDRQSAELLVRLITPQGISTEYYRSYVVSFCINSAGMKSEEVLDLIQEDGRVSRNNFASGLKQYTSVLLPTPDLMQLFDLIDTDQDGYLTQVEFLAAFNFQFDSEQESQASLTVSLLDFLNACITVHQACSRLDAARCLMLFEQECDETSVSVDQALNLVNMLEPNIDLALYERLKEELGATGSVHKDDFARVVLKH